MKIIGAVVLIILAICLIVFGPFFTIASMNILFGLNIGYTFHTWLSMVWLSLATFGGVVTAIGRLKK